MARLIPKPAARSERAQILLAGAFTLAVLLVVLAVVLNGTISVSGTQARQGSSGAQESVRFQESTQNAVSEAVIIVNTNNDSDTDKLDSALTATVSDYSSLSARLQAGSATGTNITLDSTTPGHRIIQNESRVFTSANDTTPWVLATDVSRVRSYQLNITRTNLSGFEIRADDGAGGTYNVTFDQDGGENISVSVNGDQECTIEANTSARVHLAQGRIDGASRSCDFTPFADGVASGYNINYTRADHVEGQYELVMVGTVNTGGDRYAASPSDPGPSHSDAIYSANITLTYRTKSLLYDETISVTPVQRPNLTLNGGGS